MGKADNGFGGIAALRGRRSVPGRGAGRKIPYNSMYFTTALQISSTANSWRWALDPPRLFQYSRENAPGARFLCPRGTTKSAPSPAPAPGGRPEILVGIAQNPPFSFGFPRKRRPVMTPEQLHNAYTAQVSPFLAALPDPGLRTPCSGSRGTPFFRRCALALWQAGGPLTPAHGGVVQRSLHRPQAPGDPVLGHGVPGGGNPPPAPLPAPGCWPMTAPPAARPPGPS